MRPTLGLTSATRPRPALFAPRARTLGWVTAAATLLGSCGAPQTPPAAPERAASSGPTTPPAAAPEADAFRKQVPKADSPPALHAPVPEKKVLQNGLTVLTVPKHALPLVSVSVVVRSGSAQDPADVEGLSSFVAEMLKMGTKTRSAAVLDEEVESLGASIEMDVDEDSTTVGVTALQENIGAIFDVLADILQNAKFAPEEIERVRAQRAAALAQSNDDPQRAANKVFRRVVYGTHPYGHVPLGDEAANKKIGRKQLQDYFAKHFRPANAGVVVVGDLDAATAFAEVEKRLGAWKGATPPQAPPQAPKEQPAEVVLVARPGAPQSQVLIGELGVSRAEPDYFPLVMCNAILGGLFNSRINMNLREDKGYTYGARSYFDFMRERGPFFVASGIRTDVTEQAIREVLKEIDGIRAADVSAEELDNAKSRYALSLPGYFQTVDGISGMMANLYVFDLPLDYFQHVPEHINAVTVADVRRVAQKHLQPEKLSIVVVGDKNKVEAGLGDLGRGPVKLRDATSAQAKK